MLKLEMSLGLVAKLARELRRARRREIGGVLVGEHRQDNVFRIVDLSVQRHGGDRACFIREPAHHKPFLDAFFARTGEDYLRFNYIGEWHSHPSFAPFPSLTDCEQMSAIVTDGPTAPPFAVLLIARLGDKGEVMLNVTAFHDDGTAAPADLVIVNPSTHEAARLARADETQPPAKPKPVLRLI